MTYDPSASNSISLTRHACDPDILKSAMACPPYFRGEFHFDRILRSSKEMIKVVREWTNGEVFLISNKLTRDRSPKDTFTLDVRKHEYEWLRRTIVQRYAILNDRELKEFFNLIPDWCATFCCLCLNFVEVEWEQDARQEFYFLILSYKPYLPWENRK